MSRARSTIAGARLNYSRRNLKAIAARWNARAETWDHALENPDCHLNEDDAYARFTRAIRRLIARRREFCVSRGIIDAGCGTGLVLGEVISAFSWGTGVDISPGMIHFARAKRLPNTNFVVGDCFDLPRLCPKAGAVVSRGVLLSHYGRRQAGAILHAARDALTPGGFLVFDFLNEAGRMQYSHAPENKTWFTREEIRAIARDAAIPNVKILGKSDRRVLLLLAEV